MITVLVLFPQPWYFCACTFDPGLVRCAADGDLVHRSHTRAAENAAEADGQRVVLARDVVRRGSARGRKPHRDWRAVGTASGAAYAAARRAGAVGRTPGECWAA